MVPHSALELCPRTLGQVFTDPPLLCWQYRLDTFCTNVNPFESPFLCRRHTLYIDIPAEPIMKFQRSCRKNISFSISKSQLFL